MLALKRFKQTPLATAFQQVFRSRLFAAFAMLVVLMAFAGSAHAADPTDSAGVISAMSSVFTSFGILLLIPMAFLIVGLATWASRKAKVSAR